MNMRIASVLCVFCLMVPLATAFNDESSANKELDQAAKVIQEMTTGTAGIPDSVLKGAKCIAVIPNLVKGAFIVGARHGRGVATCTGSSGWSAPAPFELSGGSFGLQAGGQSSDVVMMVMNQDGMAQLMSGHFKVGGDASVAAGPVGRSGSADAGWKAAILTYARSKGAFAGVDVSGAVLTQDNKATKALYGREIPFADILKGQVQASGPAQNFVTAVKSAQQSASR